MKVDKSFFTKMSDEKEDCVLVCSTPVSFPFNMFLHTYIVTSLDGVINRYEVFKKGDERESQKGYVYKNLFLAWVGNSVFVKPITKVISSRFPCRLIKAFDTDVAEISSLISRVEEIYLDYPSRFFYRYIYLNSNTYTQWLLNEISLEYELPVMAWGRKYRP